MVRSFVRAGLVVALTSSLLAPAASATAAPGADWSALDSCAGALSPRVTLTASNGFTVDDTVFGYRYDQRVLARTAWTSPRTTDGVYALEAYGFMWMRSLLRTIKDASDAAPRLDALVVSSASTLAWRPDNHVVTDMVWNEGTNLRRQEALNCLYAVTPDPRLVPLIKAVSAANLDPRRYYGPPLKPPHNHGLMANMALLRAGIELHRDDWASAAISRTRVALVGSFTAAGLSREQSSAYHQSLLLKWSGASMTLHGSGRRDAVALGDAIDATLVRARAALQHLLDPVGVPVRFGDQAGMREKVVPQRTLMFLDKDAGVVTRRWSWKAPDDFVAARFGARRAMHGHEDRMSLAWWASGRPVLVDPGTYTYVDSAARAWQRSQLAHSTPVVHGRTFNPRAAIAISAIRSTSTTFQLTMSGAPYGVSQSRRVVVDRVRDALSLTDVAGGTVDEVLQLDPRWRLVSLSRSRTAARFMDSTGASLCLTTTGRVSSVVRGAAGLAGGWVFHYPPSSRRAAARVVLSGGTHVMTSLRVYGAPLHPWAA
jgi:hypothetical protein